MSHIYNPVPLIPLRDTIIFPEMALPIYVGREKSIKAFDEALNKQKPILTVAQRDTKVYHPKPEDLFNFGTLVSIYQAPTNNSFTRLPDGTVKVTFVGQTRAKIENFVQQDDYFLVEVSEIVEEEDASQELKALMRSICSTFESYVKLEKKILPEMVDQVNATQDPYRLAELIINLSPKLEDKQAVHEMLGAAERLEKVIAFMKSEMEILQVEKRIRTRVKKQMEKTQKEYYLNEQMRAIQKELGEKDDFRNEIQELEDKLKAKKMPEEAKEKTEKEVRKLKLMSPMSAEATVVRNYVDWMIGLPWDEYSEDKLEILEAEKILDDDHYGLFKVKERILEHLAVQKLVGEIKGPIICFVGPPGVGKTSLGKSIARATGREFVRIALGGVRDEAEIRGHRRTYIGALPGKIVQALKRAGKSNPVILLDEIDKMSQDFRGDPSSALLEVLDPEQNGTFNDHYLDVDYDLSKVMFITTANYEQNIPRPLWDRMEVIRIAGYTELEKLLIAKRYLVPKSAQKNGLKDDGLEITDDGILNVIRHYTREAGVRSLERTLDAVCRKVAVQVVKKEENKEEAKVVIDNSNIERFLGVSQYKYGKQEDSDQVGTATGLAWTEVGGELLVIEVAIVTGRGRLMITGKLGEVMQESAQAAMMYVRSRASFLGLPKQFYSMIDLHVHVPEGATPKDGPSAGITMATAITSALTGIPVDKDIAMTGEITLRGRVLPIGGLKEKILAAHRGGITKILIPKDNEKDIEEIPTSVRKGVEIVTVSHIDEVLREALVIGGHENYLKLLSERKVRYSDLYAPEVKSAENLDGSLNDPNKTKENLMTTH